MARCRAAVQATFGDCSTVVLQAGATFQLASGTSGCGELAINNAMTIESSSTSQNATIQQQCTTFGSRVAEVDTAGLTVTLDNLNLTGGHQDDNGGALKTEFGSDTLILNADQLTGNNSGEDGGAINSHGTLQIMNSTISGNCANDGGGAVLLNSPGGPTLIQNSTISGNNQAFDGAIEDVSDALTMNYVTLVANTSSNTASCGTFDDAGAQSLPGEPNDAVPHPGVGAQAPAPPVANLSLSNGDGGPTATWTSFGTVIGDIAAASFNCSLGGDTPMSAGYNYENGGAGVPPAPRVVCTLLRTSRTVSIRTWAPSGRTADPRTRRFPRRAAR